MKCPVCKDVTLSISSRQNIEIDFCPECRGVWLDRGELDKIIELSTQPQRNDSRDRQDYERQNDRRHDDYRRDDRDYDRRDEKPYRKRSFLMDLFD